MVAAAKAAMPTVGDQAAALQLGNFAKATASALAELKAASTKVSLSLSLSLSSLHPFPTVQTYSTIFQAADACGSLEIDSAIDTVRALSNELATYKKEAHQGTLLPLPGETLESCALDLGATSKIVGSSMAQLLTAANQGNWEICEVQ